eukprot:TRINITY_DN747_c0_g1_i2.p1 TRINITY_DN747_c0_g1~~TRINITY_DN747_c0_g1_i2.p1  ORF type:complete len:624 (-),score=107.60 TRINITY_DN747_c0_g1_i2:30-1901(-)
MEPHSQHFQCLYPYFSSISHSNILLFISVFGEMFNTFAENSDDLQSEANKLSLIFVGLGLASFILIYISTTCFILIGEAVTKVIRLRLYEALIYKDVQFFDEHKTGELASRLSADTVVVQGGISEKVGQVIGFNFQLVAGLIIAFIFGWKLTLVLLACSPLIVFSGALQAAFLERNAKSGQKAYSLSMNIVEESLSGFRTVTSFGLETLLSKTYSESLRKPSQLGRRKSHMQGAGLGFSMMMIFCVYALGFWYGATLVDDGEMELGDLLIVFFSVMIGAMGLGQGGQLMPDIAKARGAATDLFALIDAEIDVNPNRGTGRTVKPGKFKGIIEFKNVKFHYPARPESPIFSKLNLRVGKGETLALVGQSGSGKSTIVSLLERFYDVQGGKIMVDGIDIRKYDLDFLRQQIGLVSQEPVLFSCTIGENIRFGRADATFKEIKAAAKKANAHDFIMELPDGYETRVGEKGSRLSGGQKQRVAIARALLKDPKILLLDEATSALDTESERLVQAALDRLMEGKTTIMIAHRLSTVRNADAIAVMSHGEICEQGTHDDLIKLNKEYALLVHRQMDKRSESDASDNTSATMSELSSSAEGDLSDIESVKSKPKKKKRKKKRKKKTKTNQ